MCHKFGETKQIGAEPFDFGPEIADIGLTGLKISGDSLQRTEDR